METLFEYPNYKITDVLKEQCEVVNRGFPDVSVSHVGIVADGRRY